MGYYSWARKEHAARQYQGLSGDTKSELEKQYPRQLTAQRQEVRCNSITALLENAKQFAAQWGRNVEDVSIDAESEYDSTYATLFLEVEGTETDEQYHARLWETREQTLIREQYELKEFKRLSAKFAKK